MTKPTTRFGRYELVRKLAGGGMGDVYLARAVGPEQVHKAVVLKRMRPERIGDEAARARFVEEARIAVSLVHPHIVPVFEFGELEGEYFLVMELLGGGELARIAGIDRPPLGWAATALLGSQLCDALTYVHSRHDRRGERLIHGDVTPRNVLLSNEGHALLSDFGLARFAPRGRAGTRRYLAPEQARGESSDARADLYSLALVLCEAATGQPAYDRQPERAAEQAKVGLVPNLDGCDPQLAGALRRALAPSRDNRFADASAMREAFEAMLDREPRARTLARSELVARTSAHRSEEAGAERQEGRVSALATREATRPPGRTRRAVWLSAALLAGGLLAFGLSTTLRKPRAHSTPSRLTPSPAIAFRPTPPPPAQARAEPKIARPPTPSAPPAHHRAPAHVAPAPAHLDVNAIPWAHVRIDGVARGETPLLGLTLPAGSHQLELTNEPLGARRDVRIELRPGEHARRLEDLTRPAP